MWNDSTENILSLLEHRHTLFLITVETTPRLKVRSRDISQEITFRGYILGKCRSRSNLRRFVSMDCSVYYRDEYTEMENEHIWIHDFTMDSFMQNKGYGSLMLEQVIGYARRNHISYIAGALSVFDIAPQHANRGEMLRHFYTKHGFTIDEHNQIQCNL